MPFLRVQSIIEIVAQQYFPQIEKPVAGHGNAIAVEMRLNPSVPQAIDGCLRSYA